MACDRLRDLSAGTGDRINPDGAGIKDGAADERRSKFDRPREETAGEEMALEYCVLAP